MTDPTIAPGSLVAVTGATGYIGTRLVPRLLDRGYRVRCLVRAPRKLADRPWAVHPGLEIVNVDLASTASLAPHLSGAAAAYYLVHSMETAGADYAARDRAFADSFARACATARVRRIIYLGGLGETGERLSAHLGSRREVERVLAHAFVPVTALRAAMVIGSGSASFEILRYLSERLPILITPRWVRTECQPIAVDNVLHYLIECLAAGATAGRTLDIGGGDIVTYEQLIQMVAKARGLRRRLVIPLPVLTPALSSLWIHLVTPISARMARPLAEGLRNRVVARSNDAERLMPQSLLTSQQAIERAIEAEARADVESVWHAAGPVPGDPDWAGGDVFGDSRMRLIAAPPERVFDVLMRLGGRQGWFRYNRLWRVRGWLDRLAGGPGTSRGRRHPDRLSWGEVIDFWRVAELDRPKRLTLRAEMRVPGDAVLDFEVAPATMADGVDGSRLTQTARFRPRGLLGLAYWYAVLPFHGPVFDGLITGIASTAEREAAPGPSL